jgi:hypothetical protein
MFWNQMQQGSAEDFKRATGVNREVFEELMVSVRSSWQPKIARQRKPAKLSLEDKVLMLLMFYREYRTFYHIGLTYGVSASTVCRTIRDIEAVLEACPKFQLPDWQNRSTGVSLELIFIDVTESPIERPSEGQEAAYSGKKNVIRSRPK